MECSLKAPVIGLGLDHGFCLGLDFFVSLCLSGPLMVLDFSGFGLLKSLSRFWCASKHDLGLGLFIPRTPTCHFRAFTVQG